MDATPSSAPFARQLGLDKSTASRLVTALQQRGRVQQRLEATTRLEPIRDDTLESAQSSARRRWR